MVEFNKKQAELIDIIDSNNNFIGKKETLYDAHVKSLWHRASHIWIYNSKGEILLQKRAAIKNYFPSLFDISAAGHISSGEEPLDCAARETEEELGIKISKDDLDFIGEIKMSIPLNGYFNNEYYYVYLFKWDGDINDLKLQKTEVDYVTFIFADELKEEIDNNSTYKKYVSHKKEYYYKVISEVKKRIKNR
jgi:isopentenyldiphosphate isomerase